MNLPENLIFLQAVSETQYFQWQIEVQITNFRKFGISNRMNIVVWYRKDSDLPPWKKVEKKYPEAKFFFYKDEGVNLLLYIPQLRPHSLKKFFRDHKEELKDKIFFYHDSDIIFNFLPNFELLAEGPVNWESNTSSYLDYEYFRRKEDEGKMPENTIIGEMARIGGISIDTIKSYAKKTGGAQYLLKGIDSGFWEDVERMCIDIRKSFFYNEPESINKQYFPNENAGLQSWCADMWAVNFSLWKRNIPTDVTTDLDFSWATDDYNTYLRKSIYHNAGSTGTQPGVFHKAKWITENPIGKKHNVSSKSASKAYVDAIKLVKN